MKLSCLVFARTMKCYNPGRLLWGVFIRGFSFTWPSLVSMLAWPRTTAVE
jgi:hypothetical protein